MLGSRSTSTGAYALSFNFRNAVPDAVTMTQHFMAHGYRTEGIGKIYHTGHGNKDDAASWSVPWKNEPVVDPGDVQNCWRNVWLRPKRPCNSFRAGLSKVWHSNEPRNSSRWKRPLT